MTCPVCATPSVPGARFCFACGAALEAVPPDAEAERRIVTVLFGDLSDFTGWAEDLDPERVGAVTDRVLAGLAETVGEYGGHVDKLTGDGIMAVFGAPVSHEDDPERAVRAAAAMQAQVRRLVQAEQGGGRRLGLRVGLNTGEVLAGMQAALSYTVIGDTVNTASRLSDAAPVGSVLAGRPTATATMNVASWRTLAPLRLKGKREPVTAYELLDLRDGPAVRLGVGEEAPLVGRDAELGLLIGRLLDVVDARVPATALLTGEAGVGKTRLASELARFAGELPQARVLWGRCRPYGEGKGLAPLVDIVRTACGIDDGDAAEAASERVRRTVGRLEHPAYGGWVPAALAERLLALLGLAPVPALAREAATPGPRPAGGELDGVVSLLTALAAEGPLLVVVDDLETATASLRSALGEVARRLTGPVLLMMVGRPDMLGPSRGAAAAAPDWWRVLPDPQVLPLVALEEPAADRLLRAYLGGDALEDPVRRELLGRAQGNPFFLAELLHLLVDRGVLRHEGAGWTVTGALPPDVLPVGVQAVLNARIDSLDPAARTVLRDAAVLGERFPAAALRTFGHHDERLTAALRELTERGLLRRDGSSYVFGHTLARDVAYAALPKAERARRHSAAAHWYAAAGVLPEEETATAVAAQAERAVSLAAEMSLPAGDDAWSARGPGFRAASRLGQDALDHDDHAGAQLALSRALRLADSGIPEELVVRARLAHAEALAGLRRLGEAEIELADALRSPREELRAGALVVLGDVRRKRGDDRGARSAFVSALAAASSAGLDRLSGESIRQLGLLDYFAGRLGDAEQRFREALILARRAADPRRAGWALQHLAWSATTRGDYELADRALLEAGEVFTELSDTGGLAWCAGTEAFVRVLQGRLAEARGLTGGLLALAETMGQRWEVAACLTIDALAAAELGRLTVAASQAEQAVAHFTETADTWGLGLALASQGLVARGRAEHAEAIGRLDSAIAVAERGGHAAVVLLALVARGLVQLDAGRLDDAEDSARRAHAAVDGLDLRPSAMVGPHVLQGLVLRARGRRAEALELLRAATDLGDGPALLFPARQARAHLAGTLVELGRPEEALSVAAAALELSGEDIRSEVVALRAYAASLAAVGRVPEARSALRRALDRVHATEQRSELAATETALAALSGGSPGAG